MKRKFKKILKKGVSKDPYLGETQKKKKKKKNLPKMAPPLSSNAVLPKLR